MHSQGLLLGLIELRTLRVRLAKTHHRWYHPLIPTIIITPTTTYCSDIQLIIVPSELYRWLLHSIFDMQLVHDISCGPARFSTANIVIRANFSYRSLN
jgi:hypothetical protein